MMPDIDGIQVLKELKSNDGSAAIPVIVVSGLDDLDNERRVRELGANAFLAKPVDPEALSTQIVACLA